MAKRLNKKVALIGGFIVLLLGMGAIIVGLRLTQNPEKFLVDGDVSWRAKDYEKAERNYWQTFREGISATAQIATLILVIQNYLDRK